LRRRISTLIRVRRPQRTKTTKRQKAASPRQEPCPWHRCYTDMSRNCHGPVPGARLFGGPVAFFSHHLSVEPIALSNRDDVPIPIEVQLEDGPPEQLVQAIGELLDADGSRSRRQAARSRARAEVTTFVRRQRAQGASANRVMALVRTAYRRARDTVHDSAIDHLAAPFRALREDVLRWAMHADAPDRFERQSPRARTEAPAGI
jgi:hypothetical protein